MVLISALLNRYSLLSFCNCFLHQCFLNQGCSPGVTMGISPFYTDLHTQMSIDRLAQVLITIEVIVPCTGCCRILTSGVKKLHLPDPDVITLQEVKFLSAHFWFHTYNSDSGSQVSVHFAFLNSPKCLCCFGSQLCFIEFSPLFPIFLFKASRIYISRYSTD